GQGRVVQPKAADQHFEAAPVALVGELGLEHVEAQLAWLGHVAARRHEFEPRAGIYESPDEPGAGDPVDMHAAARHPDAAPEILDLEPRCWSCAHQLRRLILLESRLDPGDESVHVLSAFRAEEIQPNDLGPALLQSRQFDARLSPAGWRYCPAQAAAERVNFLGESGIVGVPGRVKQRTHFAVA